jgi:hypothetical protein
MSFNSRKRRLQDSAGKFLHDLVFMYVYETICKNKDGKINVLSKLEQKKLYYAKRQEWINYVIKNSKPYLQLQDHAFKTMVDSRFVDISKDVAPKMSFITKLKLKFRKHSF